MLWNILVQTFIGRHFSPRVSGNISSVSSHRRGGSREGERERKEAWPACPRQVCVRAKCGAVKIAYVVIDLRFPYSKNNPIDLKIRNAYLSGGQLWSPYTDKQLILSQSPLLNHCWLYKDGSVPLHPLQICPVASVAPGRPFGRRLRLDGNGGGGRLLRSSSFPFTIM